LLSWRWQITMPPECCPRWQRVYFNDWRYLATTETIATKCGKTSGLGLPESVLRKIYHDDAVRWFPGIMADPSSEIPSTPQQL
jgi:hypothetical protein